MAILVHFKTSNFGYVENSELDTLIANNALYAFKRASGWVQLGKDLIRGTDVEQSYKGPERRESTNEIKPTLYVTGFLHEYNKR